MKRVLVAAILAISLAACATPVPPCAPYQYRVAQDDEGAHYVILDEENIDKLIGLIKGLAAGECRLPVKGEV